MSPLKKALSSETTEPQRRERKTSEAQITRSVSKQTFEGMHRVAQREDIDRGGLYDSRSRAINIWCSPGDRPADYGFEIKRGALNYPRDYIATIVPKSRGPEGQTVQLGLQVDPERGGTEPLGSRAEPTSEEVRWAKEKLDELVEMGEREGVTEETLVCPFCGVEAVTFDEKVMGEFPSTRFWRARRHSIFFNLSKKAQEVRTCGS